MKRAAVTIQAEPFSVSITEAAQMVGLSRTQFYRLYLRAKRVCPIRKGRKRLMIDVKELRKAYEQYVAEARADQ